MKRYLTTRVCFVLTGAAIMGCDATVGTTDGQLDPPGSAGTGDSGNGGGGQGGRVLRE